tara:strand:+ start:3262 stop:3822 length:561 start_codon:yes stop_codon:yes gene_type:complete
MATLREYLNAKLKAKGMTVKQAKKNAGKYKSISAAKKAGSLYYTDKNGKVMAAVFAEDLKKSLAPSKSIRPKARPKKKSDVAKPGDLNQPKITVEKLLPGSDKTLKETIKKKSGGRGDGAKELLQRQTDPKSPSRLRGAAVMKKITRSQWANMSKSERRALGLPATKVAAMAGKLRNMNFKDGKGF